MTTMLKSPAVAERVGVSEDTLKRWRRRTAREKKQIGPPFMRTETGLVSYPEAELEQWIKDRMVIA
jgi:predicted DNA-binding transcriptional regulator AlpA